MATHETHPLRRERLYMLANRDAIDLLNALRLDDSKHWSLGLPRLARVPQDARIVSVHACWEWKAIGVVVSHESFDEVSDGAMTPVADGPPLEIEWVRARLVRDDADEPIVRKS